MPALRTELTEIVTGLGMIGIECLDEALDARPKIMLNVTTENFDRLSQARRAGTEDRLFQSAWDNGRAFASSLDGLRHRSPRRIEWKGNHKAPGYEQLPADLRVDYVYLVSCKYRSKLLNNPSPPNLFDRLLNTRRQHRLNWFNEVAPTEYQNFYRVCRSYLGNGDLPLSVTDLIKQDRRRLKDAFRGTWPRELVEPYRRFCSMVSQASAQRWQKALGNRQAAREEMLWRLLRLQAAPYFILGADPRKRPMRFRVDTPWDFRQRYSLRSFEVWPDSSAGQSTVRWRADLTARSSALPIHVDGHVEVRWSHGRFNSAPEAKVYLDTPYKETPGYSSLR